MERLLVLILVRKGLTWFRSVRLPRILSDGDVLLDERGRGGKYFPLATGSTTQFAATVSGISILTLVSSPARTGTFFVAVSVLPPRMTVAFST